MLRRFGESLVSLIFLIFIVFLILHLVPGDPAQIALGEKVRPENISKLREEWGLDKPLPVQFVQYIGRLLQGDLGNSIPFRPACSQ